MTHKFFEEGNLIAVLAVVFMLLILTPEHAMALEDSEKEGVFVGGRPYSEVISGELHPVVIITRRDIELSGITKLSDLLSQRSNFNAFGSHRPFVAGPGRFAVAVNGRHASSFDIDFDLIPISAVERIEILKDSASAPYIGKATSAAINIIFRKDYEGLEIQSDISRPRAEGGDSEYLSVLWGDSLGEGHLIVGAEIFRRDEVRDADRDYSRAVYTPGGSFEDTQGVSTGGNTLFLTRTDGKKVVAPLGGCDESVYAGILTNPPGETSGSVCGFAHADISWHLQHRESDHVFMNLDYPVGNITFHIKGRAARSKTRLLQAPGSAGFSFVPTEMLRQDIINSIEGLHSGNFPQEIMVEHSFLGHGNRQWNTDTRDYDIEVGIEGEIGEEIGYHGDIHYNHHSHTNKGRTYIHAPAINAAISSGDYDIQNPLSETAEHAAAVGESSLRRDVLRDFHHIEATLALHGHLFEILGNELGWETGLNLAYEEQSNTYEYFNRHDHPVDPEDVLGETLNSITVDRRRLGVFGNMSVPLGDKVDLSLAGRYDDPGDPPTTIFSHRIATLYRVTPNLALRASWSRGSRFPRLFELYEKKSVSYPFVCDADTVTADCSAEQVQFSQDANPNLEPDKTETFTAGVSAGWASFYANAEWFRLRTSDIPSMLDPQLIVNLERRGELSDYSPVKVIRLNGRLTRIENLFTNSGESDIDGIDIGIKTNLKTDWADFALNANWLRVINYETRVAGQAQLGEIPRNRLHILLRAGRNDLTTQWSTHAVSSSWNNDRTRRYRRWIGHDITLNWKKAFGFSWFELTGGVMNIGNEGQSRLNQGEDQVLYLDSILGRTLFLTTKFEL